MSGFYVDADEQRQRARRAEQRLLEHDQRRPPRPASRWAEDDTAESSLPPVFRKEGYYAAGRDTSTERRAARFRDGLPPPPLTPEMDPHQIPRLLPPALPALVPPSQADQVWSPPEPEEPLYRMTAQGMVPVVIHPRGPLPAPTMILPSEMQHALSASLTPSQKKRERRKRKREGAGGLSLSSAASRPAPFPLALDAPLSPPSAVFPTHPEITQTECRAEVLVRMPNGSVHRLVCPLRPFPHPNQPHMIQLAPQEPEGAEIFIGFWMPGE